MGSGHKDGMTADGIVDQLLLNVRGDSDRGSAARTAMKTVMAAATKSSKAIPDEPAAADLGDKSSNKKMTATRAPLEETERLGVLHATPSSPHTRRRSMRIPPRTPYRPPEFNIPQKPHSADALLVVGQDLYRLNDLYHKGKAFYVSAAAIARVSPTLMEEIADYYSPDGVRSNCVTTPTGAPIWYLPGEDPRDMSVILDVIHKKTEAVASSLRLESNVNKSVAKARRVAFLAGKYKMAHELQHYVLPWFNSLKDDLSEEGHMELLEIHAFLNKATKEEGSMPANRWGITAPEITNYDQQLLERPSEPEDESRDLADIHAENVRKAAANVSNNETRADNPSSSQRSASARSPIHLYRRHGSAPTSPPVAQNNHAGSEPLVPTTTRGAAEGSGTPTS